MNTKPKIKFQKSKGFVRAAHAALSAHPKAQVFQKALIRHQAITVWQKAATEFFDSAGNQSKAVDFKDGTLFIACLSKDMANKIKMFAQRIIYILNQLLGQQLVFALRVEF